MVAVKSWVGGVVGVGAVVAVGLEVAVGTASVVATIAASTVCSMLGVGRRSSIAPGAAIGSLAIGVLHANNTISGIDMVIVVRFCQRIAKAT